MYVFADVWILHLLQEKLVTGADYVHGSYGAYRTVEDLWYGELNRSLVFQNLVHFSLSISGCLIHLDGGGILRSNKQPSLWPVLFSFSVNGDTD